MTIPKWLLPVIAIVAGLAVATAATLIGMRFATPTATVPLKTETVPILAPTGPAATDTGTDPYAVSGAVGSAEIVSPGQRGATVVDARSQQTIDRYNATGVIDPGAGYVTPAPAAAGSSSDTGPAPLPADDPCASSSPPSGCPDGIHSVVIADTHDAPALDARIFTNPATSSVGTSVYCPSGDLARGEAWVDVTSNTPGVAHISWAATGDGVATAPVDVATDAGLKASFDSYHTRTGGYAENRWLFQHCEKLTGLDPARHYLVTATFTDELSRSAGPLIASLDARGRPTVPPVLALPLGTGLLYVSVPSPSQTTGVRPVIHAWSITAGQSADCSGFGQHPDIPAVQAPVVLDVPATELERQNDDPTYRSRDVRIYSVPEGTTVVICARWFNSAAPSWSSSTPTLQKSIVVTSPDSITPVVTLHSLELGKAVDAGAVNVRVSTPTGLFCSQWTGPTEGAGPGSVAVGAPICDVAASGDGFEGRLSVTTNVRLGSDHVVTTSLLQLQRTSCTGVCALPETMRYRIDLPTVTVATGICGNGFPWEDPCTPPSQQVSLGSAVLDVSWVQGPTPGNRGWLIGTPDNILPVPGAAPVGPQLDTTALPVVGLVADRLSGGARYTLKVNEPATYTATIAGECFPTGYALTQTGSTAPTAGGTNGFTLAWDRLCPGATYWVTITLTDAAHHTTHWAISGAENRWDGSLFWIPIGTIHVVGTLYVGPQNAQHTAYGVSRVMVGAGAGADASSSSGGHSLTPSRLCTAGSDGTGTAVPLDFTVEETSAIHLVITVDAIEADPSNPPTGGPVSQCGFTVVNHGYLVWSGDVSLQSLLSYGTSFGGNGTLRSDTWTGFNTREAWGIGGTATATEVPMH
ncbi:MAG TPA: hypothetical protein VFQ74_11590 [Pseudolysinimonas sp.]|nr:hypothetical protein [Pseudolysinimonas sp.]